jgi:hypothetical protein
MMHKILDLKKKATSTSSETDTLARLRVWSTVIAAVLDGSKEVVSFGGLFFDVVMIKNESTLETGALGKAISKEEQANT